MSQSNPASNTELVRRCVAAINAGDLDAIEHLFAPEYVDYYRATGAVTGQQAMREYVAAVHRMLTNITLTIDEMIADGDKVAVRLTVRGTSAERGWGEVTFPEIHMFRITDGRIAERWGVVERNTALIRRYVAAVNARDFDAIEGLFAPDYVNHRPTGPETGQQAMREFVAAVHGTLTNLAVTIDEMIADGDKVAVRLTLRGTSGEAGREVTVREMQIYRIAKGRIAERWFVVDRTDLQASSPPHGVSAER